jgi:hypothetical protein
MAAGKNATGPTPVTATRHGRSTTGRIAVTVINHYGDEIVQVHEVPGR